MAIIENGDKPRNVGELQNVHLAYWLNGENYLKWSELNKTILKGKGKASHLTVDAPFEDDHTFKSSNEEDFMIMAWLWNSTVPKINYTCMFLNSTKVIWIAIEQFYYEAKDVAQIYDEKVKTMSVK